MAICSHPGCPTIVARGACPVHRTPDRRPNSRQRGYSTAWDRTRRRFLEDNPTCVLCGGAARVADHWPLTRRQLLALGDPHPDAWERLRPLCRPCHSRETALHDGAFGRTPTPIADRLAPRGGTGRGGGGAARTNFERGPVGSGDAEGYGTQGDSRPESGSAR